MKKAGENDIIVRVSVATPDEETAKRVAREFARVVNADETGSREDHPTRD